MAKQKILIQLDADPQPSVFDAIVAFDAGAEQILRHGGVTVEQVRELVYGGMFTRSPADLKSTAIFIGGSNVGAAEKLLAEVRRSFFGPLRMSVLIDANGANTTAAAAVHAAARHLAPSGTVSLANTVALVLAGTGPVGSRVARLLACRGARIRVGSRDLGRAEAVCRAIEQNCPAADISPCLATDESALQAALDGVRLVVAAGPPGVELFPASLGRACPSLQMAIDLNAVPPLGIEGIPATAAGEMSAGIVVYGAIGVGGLKMKIHKRAIQRLFESNDVILDAEEVLELAAAIDNSPPASAG